MCASKPDASRPFLSVDLNYAQTTANVSCIESLSDCLPLWSSRSFCVACPHAFLFLCPVTENNTMLVLLPVQSLNSQPVHTPLAKKPVVNFRNVPQSISLRQIPVVVLSASFIVVESS